MYCAQCGAANNAPAKFCFKCGASLSPVATPPVADPRVRGAALPAAAEPPVATGTNPVVVAILSFVPGLGQLINGDIKKGAVMFLLAVVLGSVTFGLGWIAVVIWSMVDAYKVAAGTGKRW